MRYVLGIDVGGTNLVAGVLAEDGSEILGVVSEPTLAAQGADPVIGRIVKLAKASMKEAGKKVEGVGIGSPGPLNTKTGVGNGGVAPRVARST
ncbi:MAG: ROK family protein [Gemmatimonadetes bacterium]|nr:ROK family protein [Gemmatimonadota bacterium]